MSKLWFALPVIFLLAGVLPLAAEAPDPVSPEVTIAFLGDQGLVADAGAVLGMIRDEGADAVIHTGDFDYQDDPAAWEAQIDAFLGPDFPYFASVGNHDEAMFYGPGGYQELLEARMNRLGIPWEGDLGVRSSFYFEGILVVMTAPGSFGDGDTVYAPYIRDVLAADHSLWSISAWHKNMRLMQVGGKSDETGWGVYEESRRGGAIIATAHEHTYSRTHLLADFENQVVASTEDPLVLVADDPATPEDEGRSFAFVSGLGGSNIRNQELDGPWWASIYTSDQGARPGALFGIFHYQGDPNLARFYFKDIDGQVVDDFFVTNVPVQVPSLQISDAAVAEGDVGSSEVVLGVSLLGATGEEVTVDYATVDGDAVAGEDYEATSGRLVFSGDVTDRSVSVRIWGDESDEGEESLFVELLAADGAIVARPRGEVIIVDDDEPPAPLLLEVATQGAGLVTLDPPGGLYPPGTQVRLTAAPEPGNAFAGWSGDLAGATNPVTLLLERDLQVVARFAPLEVSLLEVASGTAGNEASISTASALTPVDGDLYLAAISFKPNVSVADVSGLGLAWSPVRAQCGGRSQTGLAVWQARGEPTEAGVVTATFSDAPQSSVLAVSRYGGAYAVDPPGASSANSLGIAGACAGGSDGDAYAFDFDTAAASSLVYLVAASRNRDHRPGPGFAERAELFAGSAGNVAGISVADSQTGAPGTVAIEGSFSGAVDWAVVALELPVAAHYQLIVEPSPGGSVLVDPPSGPYVPGTLVTLTAIPEGGHRFAGWSGALSGAGNPAVLAMEADETVAASFVPQATLSVTPAPGGSIALDPPGGVYDPGTPVTLTATPNPGWIFLGWDGDLAGAANPASLVVDGDLRVGARFVAPVSLQQLESGTSGNVDAVSTDGALAAVGGHLYVAAIAFKPDAAVSSVSGLGLEWVPVGHQCSARGQTGLAVWQARGRPIGDGVVTASFSSAPQNSVLVVSRYANADALDAAGGVFANTVGIAGTCAGGEDRDAYALQLDTTMPGGLVYVATAMRHRDHLPGSPYVERIELYRGTTGGSTAGLSMADLYIEAPGRSAVEGRFDSIVDWAAVALEIPPSLPAAQPSSRHRR